MEGTLTVTKAALIRPIDGVLNSNPDDPNDLTILYDPIGPVIRGILHDAAAYGLWHRESGAAVLVLSKAGRFIRCRSGPASEEGRYGPSHFESVPLQGYFTEIQWLQASAMWHIFYRA